jgi:hypothetical protein
MKITESRTCGTISLIGSFFICRLHIYTLHMDSPSLFTQLPTPPRDSALETLNAAARELATLGPFNREQFNVFRVALDQFVATSSRKRSADDIDETPETADDANSTTIRLVTRNAAPIAPPTPKKEPRAPSHDRVTRTTRRMAYTARDQLPRLVFSVNTAENGRATTMRRAELLYHNVVKSLNTYTPSTIAGGPTHYALLAEEAVCRKALADRVRDINMHWKGVIHANKDKNNIEKHMEAIALAWAETPLYDYGPLLQNWRHPHIGGRGHAKKPK